MWRRIAFAAVGATLVATWIAALRIAFGRPPAPGAPPPPPYRPPEAE